MAVKHCVNWSVGRVCCSERINHRETYSDLNNLHTAISRHEKSESHIHAWISLGTFGKSRIDLQLDEHKRASVLNHNKTVKQNREVLKRLTAATCFLGPQELAFRGHNEGCD